MMNNTNRLDHRGFTIVELMIALAVLSVLLLICTLTLLNLGKMYTKGNNQADAQNTARNVISDIANDIQLGGASPDLDGAQAKSGSICIGTTRYSYVIGRQVGVDQDDSRHFKPTKHALWRDTLKEGGVCPVIGATDMNSDSPGGSEANPGSGRELIPNKMRLTEFNVTPHPGNLYTIKVGIAFGDDDLLCDRHLSNDCTESWIVSHATQHANHLQDPAEDVEGNIDVGCVGDVGQQFCGVSTLSTTVARRLSGE